MPNPELLEKPSLPSPTPHQSCRAQQFLSIALLFITLSLSFWLFVSPAAADQQRPDAPGSITGRITNAQGEPLANMAVTLYRNTNPPWYQVRGTQTQADGYYRFSLVDSGIYRIGVTDHRKDYASTFYPTARYLEEAAELTIIGNSVSNIDMVMTPGGAITGHITVTAWTLGISEVRLYEKLGTDNTEWRFSQAAYFPSGYPEYQLRGLPAGLYRLCVITLGITIECYNNVYSIENALDLTVTAGITLSNINIAFGDATDAAQLHGRITSVDDAPLPHIGVIARPVPARLPDNTPTPDPTPPFGPPPTPTALPYPSPTPDPNGFYGSYYTYTTTTGDYQFSALPPGTYQLQFRDPAGNYAFEYYDDALTEEQATPLELKERTMLSNINARLIPGAHITGVITVHGQPVQETLVGLYQQTAAGWRFVTSVRANAFSGQYVLDALPPGVYRLTAYASVYDFVGDVFSGTSYWGAYGGNRLEEGSDITLSIGETKTAINLNLTNGPQFNSAIAGRVTSDGAPVAGIKVALYSEHGCCMMQPLVYVYTDTAGRYAIQGLSSGTFQIAFFDPAGIYARTFYKDKLVGSQADPIKVEDDETQTADVALVHGGALSGTVQTVTGQPVSNLYVMLYLYFDGGYELVDRSVQTDANGKYRIVGLQAGAYEICFERDLWSYAGECYGAPDGWSTPSYTGPSIQVEAGKTHSDIDLIWGPDRHIYLPWIAQ